MCEKCLKILEKYPLREKRGVPKAHSKGCPTCGGPLFKGKCLNKRLH